ncbi:hypothetical protein [Aquiflexum sp.]|uniref:hypothetical protein n=1 Tax=Aquiflexum sp. TaxID=1872584 RepID=UPI003593E86F
MKHLAKHFLSVCMIIAVNLSCTNRSSEFHDTDDISGSEISADSLEEDFPGHDTVMNFREGRNINERSGDMDTIQLPQLILDEIKTDSLLNKALIVEIIKREVNNEMFYEVKFYPVNGRDEEVIFDSKGKRNPKS